MIMQIVVLKIMMLIFLFFSDIVSLFFFISVFFIQFCMDIRIKFLVVRCKIMMVELIWCKKCRYFRKKFKNCFKIERKLDIVRIKLK